MLQTPDPEAGSTAANKSPPDFASEAGQSGPSDPRHHPGKFGLVLAEGFDFPVRGSCFQELALEVLRLSDLAKRVMAVGQRRQDPFPVRTPLPLGIGHDGTKEFIDLFKDFS